MKLARRLDRRAALRNQRRSAVKDQIRRGLRAERLEDRSLLAADLSSDFWNFNNPADVNADGTVAPNDALAIIDQLNSVGSHLLPQGGGDGESGSRLYVDVNNDSYVSPADALSVINELNGEGQAPVQLAAFTLSILNSAGQVQTGTPTIQQGQDFFLRFVGQDLRGAGTAPNNKRGVFAAYADVLFSDHSLVTYAVNEIQTISFPGATSGTFTLSNVGTGNKTTAAINYDTSDLATTATAVAAALNAANVLGPGSVTVVANDTDSTLEVTFSATRFINEDQPLMNGGANATVAETVKGTALATRTTTGTHLAAIDYNDSSPPLGAYTNQQKGLDATDRIDELGAFTSTQTGLNRNPIEVLRVHLIAKPLTGGATSATEAFTLKVDGTTITATTPTGDSVAPEGIERPADNSLVFGNPNANPVELSAVAPDQITLTNVSINITSGPVAATSFTATAVNEGATATIDVITGHTSLNQGASGTIVLKSVQDLNPAASGTLTMAGNNAIFTPTDPNFNGTVTFTYTAGLSTDTDPTKFATATVTLPITAINDAPTLDAISNLSINEDAATVVNLTGISPGPANEASQTLTITATSSNTALIANPITVNYTTGTTGSLNFTPVANESGTATITVTVMDNGGTALGGVDTTVRTFIVTVNSVNDAPENLKGGNPIASGNNSVVAPGATFTFTGTDQLSIRDVDAGSASLTTVLSLGAGQGTLTVGSQTASSVTVTGTVSSINSQIANVVYTPGAGFSAALTMTTTDNAGGTDTDTITISRDPGIRPFAVDDPVSTPEDTSVLIDVLSNDFKADSPAVTTITNVSTPAPSGTAVVENGQIRFTPVAEFNGDVTFTYTIDDNDPNTNGTADDRTATVLVHVTPVNDAPVAVPDSFGVELGKPLTVPAPGVLGNDTDIDNPTSSLKAVDFSTLAGLVPNANGDGGFTYTPAARGTFTFTYRAQDPAGAKSDPATVTINVAAAPTTVADQLTAQEGAAPQSVGNVLSNDSDPEGGTLTVSGFTQPASGDGTVAVAANGTVTYTAPNGDFNTTRPARGPVTFTYTAKSSVTNIEATGSVSITVTEVNDNPTANDDTFLAVKKNAGGTIGVDQPVPVLVNDSFAPDVDETLTVTGIGAAAGPFTAGPTPTTGLGSVRVGTLPGSTIPTVLYTSPTTAPTTDSFFYQISDGRGGTAIAKVDVNVVDFVPKTVSGTVYVDSNGDGQVSSGEKVLSGVAVHLVGTAFDNAAVSLNTQTDANGNYSFANLKPPAAGTSYTITEDQPLFLLNGLDTYADATPNIDTTTHVALVSNTNRFDNAFLLSWSITDLSGDVSGLIFGEGGIDTRSPSQGGSLLDASGIKQEYLASSGQNGFVFGLDASGNVLWSWEMDPTGSAWAGATSISAHLSSDLSLLTFTANGHTVTLSQTYSIAGSTARFRILGIGAGGQYIIRVDGSAAGSTASQPFDGMFAANGSGGEGEAAVNREYANSADAVFTEESWA